MAASEIQVDYDALSDIMNHFWQQAEAIHLVGEKLNQQTELLEGTWIGEAADSFFRTMYDELLPAVYRLTAALAEGHDVTQQIITIMREAEEQAAGNLNWEVSETTRSIGLLKQQIVTAHELKEIQYSKFPDTLVRYDVTRFDIMQAWLRGDLTTAEARQMMTVADEPTTWKDHVDARVKLAEGDIFDWSGGGSQWSVSNESAAVQANVLSTAASGGYVVELGEDGLEIKADMEASLYITRLQGSAEMNGFQVVGDAYIGATASVEGGIEFDPFDGDAKIEGELDLFAGAKAEGVVGYDNEFFSINLQGSVSAGAGVEGEFDLGFDDGVFEVNAEFLGTLGVGGGAGIQIELDVSEAGNFVVDQGKEFLDDAVEDVSGFIGSLWADN